VIPCDGGLSLGRNAAPASEAPHADVDSGRGHRAGTGRDGGAVLVIGTSSGIGAAGALELARRGNDVVLASRRTGHLELVANQIRGLGRSAWALPCDAAEETPVREAVDRAFETAGAVDALLYSAGSVTYRPAGPIAQRRLVQHRRGGFYQPVDCPAG
jgi:3-oxoacyl-[acyl-carrier protein] reductase